MFIAFCLQWEFVIQQSSITKYIGTIQLRWFGTYFQLADYVFRCTVASVQKRHVAIARLRHPAVLGRTCQEVWFIILVVTSTKEVSFLYLYIFTGRICRRQLCRYFVYSRADFGVFRPAGATLCTDQGQIWQEGGDHRSAPPCQIWPWSVQGWGFTAPKTEKNRILPI